MSLLLLPIESAINQALKNDSCALQKIASIQNQVIQINCTDYPLTFFIFPHTSGLQLETRYQGNVNAVIQGTLHHFLQLLFRGANMRTLFLYPVTIQGDMHPVEILRDAFKNLNVDLEEKLSQWIGDVATHRLASCFQAIKKSSKKSLKTLKKNAQEFIYFETKSFPVKKQIEKFYTDIAILRNDVERMEIHLHHIISKKINP